MNADLMGRLRKELEDERDAAVEELRSYGADPYSERIERPSGIDENFADSAAATAERSEMLAFIEAARERLAEAEAALRRMDEGTYGICADCGRQIPEARLEARPLAVRCVECAAKA